MAQYAVVTHDLSRDVTRYHGPYGDGEWLGFYEEINAFYRLFDFVNIYVIEMQPWPEGLIDPNAKPETLE